MKDHVVKSSEKNVKENMVQNQQRVYLRSKVIQKKIFAFSMMIDMEKYLGVQQHQLIL